MLAHLPPTECGNLRYELPSGTFTFYYMELALEAKLQRKVNQLKEILTKSKGQIQYDWKAVQYIQSRYSLSPILCILCLILCISYTVCHPPYRFMYY